MIPKRISFPLEFERKDSVVSCYKVGRQQREPVVPMATTHQYQEFSIELFFDRRGNHYHVHSPSVAGLHLAGTDLSALRQDIEPAVRDLLRYNSNVSVDTIRWVP